MLSVSVNQYFWKNQYCYVMDWLKSVKQAGAELIQAQLKLGCKSCLIRTYDFYIKFSGANVRGLV